MQLRLVSVLLVLSALITSCSGASALGTRQTATASPTTRVPTAPVFIPATLETPEMPVPSTAQSTVVSTVAQPTATVTPAVNLIGPLQINQEAGLLYMPAWVSGVPQIAVLTAADGSLQAVFPVSGPFALDAGRNRLYVDQGDAGLTVLDSRTGANLHNVPLPPTDNRTPVHPQLDANAGLVIAFRQSTVYIIDPEAETFQRTITTQVRMYDSENLPIAGADYDPSRHILYLTFAYSPAFRVDYSAIVAYDLITGTQLGRQEFVQTTAADIQTVVAAGILYGRSTHAFGPIRSTSFWRWEAGRPQFTSRHWTGNVSAGPFYDPARARLYAATDTNLLVVDAGSLTLLTLAPGLPGELVGYGADTTQVYSLNRDETISTQPLSALAPPPPEPLAVRRPDPLPVRLLQLQSQKLFGIWQADPGAEAYMPLGRSGGTLYSREADGNDLVEWTWRVGGLYEKGMDISALAVSPRFVEDETAFIGVVGLGIFKTTDGGRLWRPAAAGLDNMQINQLLISTNFASDQTIFAQSLGAPSSLYRSQDGGQSWQRLSISAYRTAISPEFGQDRTLLAVARTLGEPLYRSQDGGDSWSRLGNSPGTSALTMLSVAPLYSRWGVAFAFEENGILYRSQDGGQSWTPVLSSEIHPALARIVYAPDMETNRPVYLLVTPLYNPIYNTASGYQPSEPPPPGGRLYRSGDGGQSWEAVDLPADFEPTALTISPAYPDDRLIYLGTANGRVMAVDTRNPTRFSIHPAEFTTDPFTQKGALYVAKTIR